MQPTACHIIVAAGSGSRFGAPLPKQFCNLADGRPVLMTTIERLRRADPEADMIVVLSEDMKDRWLDMCRACGFESPRIATGGATRWHSVRSALDMVDTDSTDVITVHDGARPVVSREIVADVLAQVRNGSDGAIPAVAVTDSLRAVGPDGRSSHAVDRTVFRAVQTPQAFRAASLIEAYRLDWRPEFTDDASVMEAAGFTDIVLTQGSPLNIKITHPGDIEIADLYLAQ